MMRSLSIRCCRNVPLRSLFSTHPVAAKGFTKDSALAYNTSRPSYPHEALEIVHKTIGNATTANIYELGAGTGLFTRAFLNHLITYHGDISKIKYTATDPSDGFRTLLTTSCPEAIVKRGVGEVIEAADQSLDAVVVAQAFHWMANRTTMQECHRVLKPNAPLIMAWNAFDTSIPWLHELEYDIIDPFYKDDVPRYSTYKWQEVFNDSFVIDAFAPLERFYCGHFTLGTVEMIVDRVLCISVIETQTSAVKHEVAQRVRNMLLKHSDEANEVEGKKVFRIQYNTEVAFARAK